MANPTLRQLDRRLRCLQARLKAIEFQQINARPRNRGDAHHAAKLSREQVGQVRQLFAGGYSAQKIATRYGVSSKTVWDIVSGRTWKHL